MSDTLELDLSEPRCASCGRKIPPDASGGLCPSCMLAGGLEQEEPPSAAHPGRRLGSFELVEEIGRGGMGVVWRARQLTLKREVALKMILQGSFASELERRRFQSEAEAAAALAHPNIVPIYEVGEMEAHPFYAMKLISGGSLAERLVSGRSTPTEAASWVARLARGVHYAHQHGILHRDLKPGNILLEDDEPMIADFGLAKRLTGSAEITATGSVVGSPSYMAPEQAEGRTADISTATDIYSLGAILFHFLTGQAPFQAETPLATLRKVVEAEPSRVRALNPKVDRDLETICLKCLAKQPARRYASADALREDLERWLRRQPILARRAPAYERVWKWTRRHPAIAAGVLAVLVTAALGVAGVRAQFRQTQLALQRSQANALAERSARASVIQPERADTFEHEVRVVLASPDRRQVLIGSGTNVCLREFHGATNRLELRGHTSFVRLAEWSSDGRRVVTVSTCQKQPVWDSPLGAYGDQTARLWDAGSGEELAVIAPLFSEPISSVALNGDGSRLALGSVDGSIGVWAVGRTNPLFMVQVSTSQVMQVSFSRNGSNVLASSSGDLYWIRRPDPNGGTYGMQSFNELNLVRAFDLSGQPVAGFANNASGMVRYLVGGSVQPQPNRSSRTQFALSPDGACLATGAEAPENNALWDTATGRRLASLEGPGKPVRTLAFSRDGKLVAAGSTDHSAYVWDRGTGRQIAVLRPHPREVTLVAFAQDRRWLLTGCADNKLRIWDVESGVCVAVMRGHRDAILAAELAADGEEILSGSADQTVRLWRWATFDQLAVGLAAQQGAIKSIRFSPDSGRVVTGSADGTAQVCEVARGRRLLLLDPQLDFGSFASTVRGNGGAELRDAAFTPDGRQLVTARSDPSLASNRNPLGMIFRSSFPPRPQPFLPGRCWDAESGSQLAAIQGGTAAFNGIQIRADGERVLFRGEEYPRSVTTQGRGRMMSGGYSHGGGTVGEAVLWDLRQQRQVALLDAGSHRLKAAIFNPRDGTILTATSRMLQLWSSDGDKPHPLPGVRGRDWTAFSPDGRLLLSEDTDYYPAVWDVASLEKLGRFEGLGTNVWEAWFGEAAATVGALNADGRLITWATAGGAVTWEGLGSGKNTGLTLTSPDGRWLATVVGHQGLDLWDLRQQKLLRTVERHVYPVTAVGFSTDGQWLGSGDSSGVSWIWPLRLAGETQ